jgi:hypothetical protein
MFKTITALLLASLIVGPAAAQGPPDFSGRWVLTSANEAGPSAATQLTVSQSAVRTNGRGTAISPPFVTLVVQRRFATAVRSEKYSIGVVGGLVGGIDRNGRGPGPNGESLQTRFSTRWDGDRVVIETASYSGRTWESGQYTERDEIWWLNDENTLYVEVTERASGAADWTATLVYARLTYDAFIALDVEQRRKTFAKLDAATKTFLVRTHGERWLAGHRAQLTAGQVAAVQAFIDFIPEVFGGGDSTKRELELAKVVRCEVGESAFGEAFAILHPPADGRRSWRDIAYEWLEWFDACVG